MDDPEIRWTGWRKGRGKNGSGGVTGVGPILISGVEYGRTGFASKVIR